MMTFLSRLALGALILAGIDTGAATATSRTVHMHVEVWNMMGEDFDMEFQGPYAAYGAREARYGIGSSPGFLIDDKNDVVRVRLETADAVATGSKDRIHSGHTRHFTLRVRQGDKIRASIDMMMKINLKGVRECHPTGHYDPDRILNYGMRRDASFDGEARAKLMLRIADAGVMNALRHKYASDIAADIIAGNWVAATAAIAANAPGDTGTAIKGAALAYYAIDSALKSGPDTCFLLLQVVPPGDAPSG